MAVQKIIITPILVFLMTIFFNASSSSSSNNSQYPFLNHGVRSAYWPAGGDFLPSSINTNYFTHIFYAFIQPDPISFNLIITKSDKKWAHNFTNELRHRYPPVKTLFSIGGGTSNSTLFSEIASTKQNREIFINSTIHVARKYGFDGVDLDWEFPQTEKDMFNLGLLYEEWYNALFAEAIVGRKPRLLLTSAVYYNSTIRLTGKGSRSYPAHAINKYLDWASPMCFDYHGSWANNTGFNAALYDPESEISTNFGIRSWIKSGVRPEKLVMGLALYGRTWELKDPNVHGVGADAVGPATDTDGSMNYNEILKFNKDSGANVVYDKVAVSFYSYAGTTWIGYDDVPSITTKVRFAKSLGLKGYFFWALGKDKDWTISRQASNTWGH
ncbi:unnamed protein product [Trifolium pratense]|uniref:Uncharacterized protein n=1 Tax=Trifolium pratense TaxID=57577 RepID=A0ACB0M366_TRIPR|nr:unnamed protein product [Trifolium pratense]